MENEINKKDKTDCGEEEIDFSSDDYTILSENKNQPINVNSPCYANAKKEMEDIIASGQSNPILDFAVQITTDIYKKNCESEIQVLEERLKNENLSEYEIALIKWEIDDKNKFIEHLAKSKTIQEIMSYKTPEKPLKEDFDSKQ